MNNLTILLTGGTGSFGNKFINMTLKKYNPKKIIIFSRDEMKQWHMSQKITDKRVRFFLGDVRDKDRLNRAVDGVDIIIHAAALKIVPTAEYNPFETVKTNIIGAMNIIDVAIEKKIKKVIALSTDKACDPINFYGATKLASDKLFIAGNNYVGKGPTKFSIVRYGNVIGSRGSVIPFFLKLKKENKQITITDKKMTRFFTSLEDAVKMVWKGLNLMQGGEVFVLKNPSIKISDLAKVIDNKPFQEIGIRPGEKLHEILCPEDCARDTLEFKDYYLIKPSPYNIDPKKDQSNNYKINKYNEKGKFVKNNFVYNSGANPHFLTIKELKKLI